MGPQPIQEGDDDWLGRAGEDPPPPPPPPNAEPIYVHRYQLLISVLMHTKQG